MNKMVSTLTIAIAVSGEDHYSMFMIGKSDTSCNRKGPAMEAVKGIALYIVREFCGLTNTRDDRKLMRLNGEDNSEIYPQIVRGDLAKQPLKEIVEFFVPMLQNGGVTMDERLEEWFREKAGAPAREEEDDILEGGPPETVPGVQPEEGGEEKTVAVSEIRSTLTAMNKGELKRDQATRSIPVIGLSALAHDEDRERALAAGCSGYITKPYRIKQLLDTVQSALRNGH